MSEKLYAKSTQIIINKVKNNFKRICIALAFGGAMVGCNKEIEPLESQQEMTSAEVFENQELAEAVKLVSSVLGDMYKDPQVLEMVEQAVRVEHYVDDRMPLKDLLYPNNSLVFKKVNNSNARLAASSFRDKFNQVLNTKRGEQGRNARTKNYDEEFFVQNGITIYFPYSRWFKDKKISSITVVAAPERDSNVAKGVEYTNCGKGICSTTVNVDEKYVQTHPTHIVQAGGADVAKYRVKAADKVQHSGARTNESFLKVWICAVRCVKQYDALFSLTGNGGGSEIKISRTSGYLKQDTSGQITSPENVVSADIPRDFISLGIPVEINAEWDQNWEADDKEQFFAIYEEDTKGSSEYGGSIKTTLKKSDGSSVEGGINVKITVQTQDEIIVQHGWERAPFLAGNNSNQAWGTFNPNEGYFFHPGPWAIYDGPLFGNGGANVSFVTPHKFY